MFLTEINIPTFFDLMLISFEDLPVFYDHLFWDGAFATLYPSEQFLTLIVVNIWFSLSVAFIFYLFIYILRAILTRL